MRRRRRKEKSSKKKEIEKIEENRISIDIKLKPFTKKFKKKFFEEKSRRRRREKKKDLPAKNKVVTYLCVEV